MEADSTINGVSVKKDGGGGCWCFHNMKSLSKSDYSMKNYETCFLQPGMNECYMVTLLYNLHYLQVLSGN